MPNFGKTCLKLPPTCDGTPSPAGTSWRHPAFTGWALGSDHLSIPLIVLTQFPRFRNTGCFLQTLSQEHPYASKEGRRFTPEHHLDSGLQRQLLILLWLASLPTETPSHLTALPLQWPKHPRPSSCVPALPPMGFIFPPTGFIPPSPGARSSHSHFEFLIIICFFLCSLDILTACNEVPPLPPPAAVISPPYPADIVSSSSLLLPSPSRYSP